MNTLNNQIFEFLLNSLNKNFYKIYKNKFILNTDNIKKELLNNKEIILIDFKNYETITPYIICNLFDIKYEISEYETIWEKVEDIKYDLKKEYNLSLLLENYKLKIIN